MTREEVITQMRLERSLLQDAKNVFEQRKEKFRNSANELARPDAVEAGFSVGMIVCYKYAMFEVLGIVEDIIFRGECASTFCFLVRAFDFRRPGGSFSGGSFAYERKSSVTICVQPEDLISDWREH